MRSLVLVALLVPITGCLDVPGETDCGTPTGDVYVAEATHQARFSNRTDPDQPWDALVLLQRESQGVTVGPEATDGAVETVYGDPDAPASLRSYRMDAARGEFRLKAEFFNERDGCRAVGLDEEVVDLREPRLGDRAAVGKGVDVWTAGFWENGTLFYTNIAAVHASAVPRAGWYSYSDDQPLKVYVYDQSRAERPAYWSPCTPAQSPVRQCAPWGYSVTIEGFNEALKGLSTTTTRVVHIPPEKAYSYPGADVNGPLYGDAIVFLIVISGVVDHPCPPNLNANQCDELPGR